MTHPPGKDQEVIVAARAASGLTGINPGKPLPELTLPAARL
jgi:hypothetical protein